MAYPFPLRPDRPAATAADDLVTPVEEDVVMDGEQPISPDELVQASRLQTNGISGPRRNVVAPTLARIDRARAAHPVVGRRAAKHEQDMDAGGRDQAATAAPPSVFLVEIERMLISHRAAVALDSLQGQQVGNGRPRFPRN